mgnify:CR=1 FL=1
MVTVCLAISGGALVLNVLAKPPQGSRQNASLAQQDVPKTEIIRGTGSQQTAANSQSAGPYMLNGQPDWFGDMQEAVKGNQLSLGELAFSISVLGRSEADESTSQVADSANSDSIGDWIRGAQWPGDGLGRNATRSMADFLAAQVEYEAAKNSSNAEEQLAQLVSAAQTAYQDLLKAHAAGEATPDQLVMGVNWILDARLEAADNSATGASSFTAGELNQTLGRVAEVYRATQAGTNSPAFIKSRYYFSRAQELLARSAGNRETAGFAAKHAMQHALSRYRLLASAPINQQNLFELTEAAKNRADSLARYAALRGDPAMAARAGAELQVAVQLLQSEVSRRDDSPRNRTLARMLNTLR